jgi:hypothetical protein
MATGSFARSSFSQPTISTPSQASITSSGANTPINTTYTRNRSRGRPREDIDSEGLKNKRAKLEGIEAEALGLLITSLRGQASMGPRVAEQPLNIFERATKLLQDEYELRLSPSHFLCATELFQSESRASMFVTLKGPLRDQWLCKYAGVELLDINVNSELDIL